MRPELRDFIKKIPKRRGYAADFMDRTMTTVMVGDLKVFADGVTVTPSLLAQKGMIRTRKGKLPKVKILGGGDLAKKLVVQNCFVTAQAREKIINAGGEIKLI
jgi:large subunit ribosomal protein L15